MKNKKGWVPIALGLVLLLSALALVGYNGYEIFKADRFVQEALAEWPEIPPRAEESLPDYQIDPTREMPIVNLQGIDCIGRLQIPSLSLDLPVASEWSYPTLKKVPCRYSGSAYQENLVIAAHNYRSHFARIRNLEPGASVVLTDGDGNEFHYAVAAIEILPPTAVEEITACDFPLTLFTCTVGGSWRVSVRCESVKTE